MGRKMAPCARLAICLSLAFALAAIAAWPFAAQQQPPFDEQQIVTDLTNALQLSAEQVDALGDLLKRRRPRIEGLLQQMSRQQPGSTQFNQLRVAIEREQRAMLTEFLPSLRPDQQARLRGFLGTQTSNPPSITPPVSSIRPVKPKLQNPAPSASTKLIPMPANASERNSQGGSRDRRSSESMVSLTEDQKILHLLNRAGFGPRPGDIERIRQIGIDRYLEEQLQPEDLDDDLLAQPLQSLRTLQMALPEIVQNFMPPPPRPRPTPTPIPQIRPLPVPDAENKDAKGKEGEGEKPPTMTAPNSGEAMVAPQSMQQTSKTEKEAMPQELPMLTPAQARPTPTPRPLDTQRPLRELQQAKLLRAVFSDKQLQEVMVDFWFNHFNVFGGKDTVRFMITAYERDVIRPHALGKFKDLLVATAQSPAMLYYLDNFLSQMERPASPPKYDADGFPLPPPRRPGLNENYARELMELHTMGVEGGYTQKDVQEIARCFTGWTIGQQPNPMFIFRPRVHDKGEKTILGKRIAAGGEIEDGLRVLDLLSKHPSTARFISRKLCQRFVADEPPQSLVDRTADVFLKSEGDIRQVVRFILTSPEFNSTKYYRNKIKSPLELAASAIRATAASTDAAQPLIQTVARMGEPLYMCQPPTGYSEDSSQWLSSATLLERMNFAVALVGNRINGTRVEASRFVSPDAMKDEKRLLEQLLASLVHSDVSKETRENLSRVLKDQSSKLKPAKNDDRAVRRNAEQLIASVASLILGAREFQVK